MRLIDADALFEAIKKDKIAWRFGVPNTLKLLFDYLRVIIAEQPTIDAVPVVRCKDCKCFMEYTRDYARLFPTAEGADGDCYIRVMNSDDKQFCACKYDDFCSYGERKDGDT